MKRIICLCALFFGVVWVLSPFAAAAENWPIKKFTIVEKDNLTETFIGPVDVTTPLALKMEQNNLTPTQEKVIVDWLEEVANYFEKQGFPPPRYEEKTDKELIVYAYPFGAKNDPTALAYPDCKNPSKNTFIHLDPKRIFNQSTGKITTKGYQDLAHELFHTVQYAYPMFQKSPCGQSPGAWITEGTAEAVGIETARRLKGIQPEHVCQMGLRPYLKSLFVYSKDPVDKCGMRAYNTQSFWQFLGEYSTRKGFIATEEFAQPDFRYLHNFFSTSHAMGAWSKEYAWLDKVLRQRKRYGKHQFGISLHTAYSRFVGTFASYWKHKRRNLYPGGVGGAPAEKERKWIEGIFGMCAEASVTKDASIPSVSVALQIEPVAARCIKVNFDFTGRVNLTFYASDENTSIDLDSLAISTDGGEKIVGRDPAETHPDKLGKFSIEATSGIPQYFIVSNVAKKAGDTAGINSTIQIVPEFISTSMAMAKKKPKPKKTHQTEKEELENAWRSQSWKGHASQRKHSSCTTPFDFRLCGPSTHIVLDLVSDTAQLLDEITDPTMSLERKMRVLDAIVQNGPEQVSADVSKAVMESQQQDGWSVRIQIPQIQPGFVGGVTNAHMTVSKANNPDGSANFPYRAIGPGWVGSCSGSGLGYWPSSGQVSITEFSQHSLRGTFTAQLVGEQYPESCQPAPISGNISGSFTITEIHWGNNLSPELSEEAILDDVIEDTNELLPGMISDDMAEYIKEQAKKKLKKKEKLKQEKAAKGKETSVFQQCGCSCEMEANFCAVTPLAECCVSCQPMFKLCNGNPTSPQAAQTTEKPANEREEVQVMRKQYVAYIESFSLNDDIKKQMMEAFDQLKTVDEKKILIMSIPKK